MTFTIKQWQDSPSTTTPISATALQDLETRLSAYVDAQVLIGVDAGRPAASASNVRYWYYATDTAALWLSNGSSWVQVNVGTGGGGGGGGATISYGLLANRPAAAAGNSGNLYILSDKGGDVYRSNGSSWDKVAAGRNEVPNTWSSIAFPIPPAPPRAPFASSTFGDYYVSGTADIIVTDGPSLQTALNTSSSSGTAPKKILLLDGVYTAPGATYFTLTTNHKLYSLHGPATVVLKSGIFYGSNNSFDAGAEFHGLTFNVTDPSLAFQGCVLSNWGAGGANAIIADCIFDGGADYLMSKGIDLRQPAGCHVHRCIVRQYNGWGVSVWNNNPDMAQSTARCYLSDLDISGVFGIDANGTLGTVGPGNAYAGQTLGGTGTGEAGLWIGNTCTARRIRISDCGWMGLWTGNACNNTIIQDIDISNSYIGWYPEHQTWNTTFERFRIWGKIKNAINVEFWYGAPVAGSKSLTIRNGYLNALERGIYSDEGTDALLVERVVFAAQPFDANTEGIHLKNNTNAIIRYCDFSAMDASKSIVEEDQNGGFFVNANSGNTGYNNVYSAGGNTATSGSFV